MKKSPLVVKPVKKYKKLRYPGWQDPNPLDHPNAAPYPFSKKVLHFLTAIGMTSAAVSGCSNENHNGTNDPDWISPDSLRNTFTFEKNGLPYQSPGFGTGQPENIKRRFAIAVLENLARKEGFEMQRGFVYESEGVKVQLDGWDAKRKTGFVFVDRSNADDGIIGWSEAQRSLIPVFEQDSSGHYTDEKYFHSWSEIWDHYDRHPQLVNVIDSLILAKTGENAKDLALQFPDQEERTLRKLAFFMARFPLEISETEWDEKKDDTYEVYFFRKLSKHLKQLTSSPQSSPIQRISIYEDYSMAENLIRRLRRSKKMEEFWISLFSLPEQNERQRIIRGLSVLYRTSDRDQNLQKKFEKALSNPKIDLIDSFSEELAVFEQKTISLAEMRELDRLAASGKAYVMPVSFNDSRFFYERYWERPKSWGDYFSEAEAPPDFLDSLHDYQQKQAALPDSIQNKPKTWYEKNERDALSELERQAQYYLRWAKSQGL